MSVGSVRAARPYGEMGDPALAMVESGELENRELENGELASEELENRELGEHVEDWFSATDNDHEYFVDPFAIDIPLILESDRSILGSRNTDDEFTDRDRPNSGRFVIGVEFLLCDRSGDLADQSSDTFGETYSGWKGRILEAGGLKVSMNRVDRLDSPTSWGWGGSVALIKSRQEVTATSTRFYLSYAPFGSAPSEVIQSDSDHWKYNASLLHLSLHRFYREQSELGALDYWAGIASVQNIETVRVTSSGWSETDGARVDRRVLNLSGSASRDADIENLLFGPEIGIRQASLFANRIEFGAFFKAAALYNRATLARNPEGVARLVIPSELNSISLQDGPSTFHEFSPMFEIGASTRLHLTRFASAYAGIQHARYYWQHTYQSGEDTATTQFATLSLGLAASF
ncbi:hypothetical protein [Rubripirellula tenax]|uniref:hypothetical protein n=1 Tax=Rubripirellula tenax TaxID=2528015 RepID=UPI0016472A05|nr:hypothetical protein [Rubripirellula tenax]